MARHIVGRRDSRGGAEARAKGANGGANAGATARRLALWLAPLAILGCGLRANDVERVVIVDRDTNRTLTAYEYDRSGALTQVQSYGAGERVDRVVEVQQDAAGNVLRTVATERLGGVEVVDYQRHTEHDAAGRVTKTVVQRSDGHTVETHYGYDESGTLRRAVQVTDGDTLLMQEY